MELFWRILGHDSSKTIFDRPVGMGNSQAIQIKELLRVLTAQAGWPTPKLWASNAKRNTKIANDLLHNPVSE
jgi:hypothetical protein